MDFDFGNIIYIIATLIAVLAGVFGNKKKKPGQGKPAGTSEEGQGASGSFSLKELERILSGGQPEPDVVDLKPYEEDLQPEEEFHTHEEVLAQARPMPEPMHTGGILDEYERLMKGKSVEDLMSGEQSDMDSLEVIEREEEGEQANFFELIKEFDAAKAVVYSAIINRIEY